MAPKFVKIVGANASAQRRAPRSEAGLLCGTNCQKDGCEVLNNQSGSQNWRIMNWIHQRETYFCLYFYGVKHSKCKNGLRISSKRSRQTDFWGWNPIFSIIIVGMMTWSLDEHMLRVEMVLHTHSVLKCLQITNRCLVVFIVLKPIKWTSRYFYVP